MGSNAKVAAKTYEDHITAASKRVLPSWLGTPPWGGGRRVILETRFRVFLAMVHERVRTFLSLGPYGSDDSYKV